jgi:molecular chaperone GrpE (heat shock protein)
VFSQKKRQAEQVKKIEEIKKKVVEKLAPLLENFRAVSTNFPGETERENKMHSDFAVVIKSITIALKKYGYEEPLIVQTKEESPSVVAN